jgi:putative lipoprotein
MRTGLALVVLAVLAMLGAGPAGAIDPVSLGGMVTLEQPAEFPAGSVLAVTLEDVSLADAPAVTVAQTQIPAAGRQPPVEFMLTYPRSAIQPGLVYSVRARVTVGDTLLFTTTQAYRVDPLNPAPLDLALSPVAPPLPDAPLTGTYWKLLDVSGQPVAGAAGFREPSLVLDGQDGRFAGSGGVNQLIGGYTLQGDSLLFSQVASTMMAGPPEAMAQEQAITAALGQVRGFAIAGDRLTLSDDAGRPVLTAIAATPGH